MPPKLCYIDVFLRYINLIYHYILSLYSHYTFTSSERPHAANFSLTHAAIAGVAWDVTSRESPLQGMVLWMHSHKKIRTGSRGSWPLHLNIILTKSYFFTIVIIIESYLILTTLDLKKRGNQQHQCVIPPFIPQIYHFNILISHGWFLSYFYTAKLQTIPRRTQKKCNISQIAMSYAARVLLHKPIFMLHQVGSSVKSVNFLLFGRKITPVHT